MKNDYSKTQRVLFLIREFIQGHQNTITDDRFREIMGHPSKANYHKLIEELTHDQGELKALLSRCKTEQGYIYQLSDEYSAIDSLSSQTDYMIECYSKLGSVLPDEMQNKLNLIMGNNKNRKKNLDRKFCNIRPIYGKPLSEDLKLNIHLIIKSILEEKEIQIVYRDSKNVTSRFVFRPYTMCLFREELYLLGHRLEDKSYEFKNCKIRRILEVHTTQTRFTYPSLAKWNPKNDFQLSSGIINNIFEKFHVKIHVYNESRIVFREKIFFNNLLISSNIEYDCYELLCTNVNEFLGQLFVYAQDIEIIDNEFMKNKFIEKANKALLRNQQSKKIA